ncbi:hypothetical protein [Lishizhenia sp.]|uniref:hypothetical protein n=1 Tax=Lishizhenia sp. TaxID=2497594 RepID=UPI00299EED22|nr:hypothetical protein [Lishizhenia sp.]MDX1445408.1 hypothetical protein [Lishizhenia sp.]
MRALLYTFLVFVLMSCENAPLTQLKENLSGTWEIRNDQGELFFKEKWYEKGNQFLGEGQRFREGRLVFTEHLELKEIEGELFYLVEDVNPDPTSFKINYFSEKEFLAENLDNSFPKYIHYKISADSIGALVYGDDDTLRFKMLRVR